MKKNEIDTEGPVFERNLCEWMYGFMHLNTIDLFIILVCNNI